MKINQMIREKRKELSLAQEQIANYLGVSTPAVNKWEKGVSHS
jgi:DNA-binding transcriptional regulator YiaG